MISQFHLGFHEAMMNKTARLNGSSAAQAVGGLIGAVGGSMTAAGLGLLARSRFEEKFKEDEDKTLKDKLISKAPALLGLIGAIAGGAHGVERANKALGVISQARAAKDMMRGMSDLFKGAELKKDVKLKPHQERAIGKLLENGGSLLAAHATGSGKTLTGIAGFEKLRETGKAKRALVIVPAALRENFVQNLKRFTNSSHSTYGPKGESSSKDIGEGSSSDYNIVSYELFREHGDKLLADTGADTLIMDEIHRVRGTEGATYNKIRDLRPKFKNAITLTGSIVNNEPNDVVPLMDITYGPTNHKLVSKNFFDKLFVQKDAKTQGIFSPKVTIIKGLKNKQQLAKYLGTKVDFVSHKDLEGDMPARELQTVEVEMSPEQKKLYDFTLTSVDPITRWKIRNNLPVGQREAKDAFSKLMQARQVSTDPAVLDKKLDAHEDPATYSPKVKAVMTDIEQHLGEDPEHKTVIYGNLLTGQLNAVEKSLKARKIGYAKFIGLGNEGQTAKTRPKELQSFINGEKRVLLISGAGAEGLDLKNTSMMQMVEGHYNPERIQQAEARVRRLGAERNKVLIKRYVTNPSQSVTQKVMSKVLAPFGMTGGGKGIDSWIYSIAANKDRLNEEFRDVLQKTAGFNNVSDMLEDMGVGMYASTVGKVIGNVPGMLLAIPIKKRRDKDIEAKMKQMLLDRGLESFTKKKHYDKILAESKLDERGLDASAGIAGIVAGLGLLSALHPGIAKKIHEPIIRASSKAMTTFLPKKLTSSGSFLGKVLGDEFSRKIMGHALGGAAVGLAFPPAVEYAKTLAQRAAIGDTKDLDIGVQRYTDKMRKKIDRKYKSSKGFVNEYETKDELGIDQVSGS